MSTDTRQFAKDNRMKVAVIGNPIQHSKSPLIHNYYLEKLSISAKYQALHIQSLKELDAFMDELRAPDWRGINITIPYKEAVLNYLDDMDDAVKVIGACNTIVNDHGRLMGYNTDAEGFYYPIQNESISSVVILGNGGAAKAVLYQCAKVGVAQITLVARDHKKSSDLCDRLVNKFGANIKTTSFEQLDATEISRANIVINTTSVGMARDDVPFECVHHMNKGQIFYDLIYTPWETQMMSIALANGAKCMNGASMLAHQGALAFQHFFGECPDTLGMIKLIKDSLKK